MNWKDKRIWIVGASSGIGEGLVTELARSHASLVISSRRVERLQILRQQFPSRSIEILPLDLAEHESLDEAVATAWKCYDGFDYVFLNAGMSVRDLVAETQTDIEKRLMDVNFWAPVIITKALLSRLTDPDEMHLVITSSLSGKYGVPKLAAYASSKHALHGYFDSLRAETYNTGLCIHIAIPGFIRTEISVSGLKGDGAKVGTMQAALDQGMDPHICARKILKNVARGKEEFVVGGSERFTVFFNRLFPGFMKRMIRSRPLKRIRNLKKKVKIT